MTSGLPQYREGLLYRERLVYAWAKVMSNQQHFDDHRSPTSSTPCMSGGFAITAVKYELGHLRAEYSCHRCDHRGQFPIPDDVVEASRVIANCSSMT